MQQLDLKKISQILFETATEGLLVTDDKGVIQLLNPRVEELFGYSQSELIGHKVEMLVPSTLRKKHQSHRQKFHDKPAKRTMGQGMDLLGQRKNGTTFPIEIALNHFKVEGSTMVMALISDITKKVDILNQLKKEKETEQMYLDVAGTMFLLIDNKLQVKLINQKGANLIGLPSEQILHKNWMDHFVPQNCKNEIKRVFEDLLQSKSSYQMESSIITANKEEKIIAWNFVSVINGNEHEVTGILGSGEDITLQKEAEKKLAKLNIQLEERVQERTKALEKSQLLYKMISRNFPNGVINVLDKNLNYVFVEGQELYKMGITSEKLVGTKYVDRLEEPYRQQISDHLAIALEGLDSNFELKTKTSTYSISAVGLKDYKGKVSQILVVEQNITSQKKAEEEMLKALEKERQLNELKSRFVSMASHEFRTPLTTVLSSVSLMSKYIKNTPNEDKQLKHVGRIKSSVRHLTNLLEDFLSLERFESGLVKPNKEFLNLGDFMKDVVEEMQQNAKPGQKIVSQINMQGNIYTDKQIFKGVLHNLLSNSIKYSAESSVIEMVVNENHKNVIFMVKDNGIGIPANEQDQLFDRFFRANNAINIQGSGLGLSIVKKYVELLNGSIQFNSVENKGSEFIVQIPNIKK